MKKHSKGIERFVFLIFIFVYIFNFTTLFAGNDTKFTAGNLKSGLTLKSDTNIMVQSVTFNLTSPVAYGKPDYDPGAVASSGLGVVYTSSDTNVVSIVNNKIHIKKIGVDTIFAYQKGNDSILPASAKQTLIINRASLYVLGKTDTINCGKKVSLNSSNISFMGLAYNEKPDNNLLKQLMVATSANGVMGKYPITVTGPSVYNNYNLSYINGVLFVNAIGPVDTIKNLCNGDSAILLPDDSIVKTSGKYLRTFSVFTGCNTIVSYNINFIAPVSANFVYKKCVGDSLKVGNSFVKISGIYKDTIRFNGGCDSLYRTINLTFQNKPKVDAGLDQEICKGDSVNLVATGNGQVTWQGFADSAIFVSPASTSIYTAVSSNACGSVFSNITLKVDLRPGKPLIYVNGGELTTDINTSLSTIQWYESRFGAISGATDWKYIPKQNGSYFVVAKNGLCYSSPSETIQYTYTDINSNSAADREIYMFPNPVENELRISYKSGINKIEVFNTIGNLILSKFITTESSVIIDASKWKGGVYMVKVWSLDNSISPVVKAIIKK